MPRAAWIFLWFILLTGLALGVVALYSFEFQTGEWATFAALAAFATAAQLSKTLFKSKENREGGNISYSPLLVFLAAGIFVLAPGQFALLVVVPHGIEWVKEHRARRGSLPAWYIQPFNVASHWIIGLT